MELHRKYGRDAGFTLIELLVALLILGIVLTAVAPALYGSLRAQSGASHRSVADGLAVSANEQLRSLPYYEVGYGPTPQTPAVLPRTSGADDTPQLCTSQASTLSLSTVTIPADGPVDTLSVTRTVSNEQYAIVRCLYWQTAAGDTQAVKESVVTVTWLDNSNAAPPLSCQSGVYNCRTVTETSDIYPGGQSNYAQSGPANNFAPSQAPTSTTPGPTPAPASNVGVTVQKSGSTPTNSVTVSWTASASACGSTITYLVQYNTSGTFDPAGVSPPAAYGLYAQSSPISGTSTTIGGLTPGIQYYFQVVAVCNTAPSAPTAISNATAGGTVVSSCNVYNLIVSPNQAQIDSYGYLTNSTYVNVSVNANSACTTGSGNGQTLWVYYPTSSTSLNTLQLFPGTNAGMYNAVAGVNADSSNMAWTPGTKQFQVYTGTNSTAPKAYTNPTTVATLNLCQPNPVSGVCQ